MKPIRDNRGDEWTFAERPEHPKLTATRTADRKVVYGRTVRGCMVEIARTKPVQPEQGGTP